MARPAVSLQNVKHANMPNRNRSLPSIQSIQETSAGKASSLLATSGLAIVSLVISTCLSLLDDWLTHWARKTKPDNLLEELYLLTTQQTSSAAVIKKISSILNLWGANTLLKLFWMITASNRNTISPTTIPSPPKNGFLIVTINVNFGASLGRYPSLELHGAPHPDYLQLDQILSPSFCTSLATRSVRKSLPVFHWLLHLSMEQHALLQQDCHS